PAPPPRRPRLPPMTPLKYVFLTTLAILFVAPFIYMVSLSFQPLSDMFAYPPRWIPAHTTLENYAGFFSSEHPIYRWIFNSMFVSVTVTVLQLFFNSLLAY